MASSTGTKRCSTCSALNGADAQWCNQCHKRFMTAPPPPPPPPVATSPAGGVLVDGTILGLDDPQPQPGGQVPVAPQAAVGTQRGAFKVTEAGVVWECTQCGTENPLDETYCSVCGAAFADVLRPPAPERVKRDPGMTAIWSLVFPGAGHGYLGMWGQAVARASISVWVTLTALLTAIQAENGLPLVTIIFGLAATALWIVHAHDAYREALGDPRSVLLKGKLFLYVVLGLLTLLILLLVGAALGGRSDGGEGLVDVGVGLLF